MREIVPETRNYKIVEDEQPRSPGLKHRHYSPKARVVLVQSPKFKVQSSQSIAFIGLNEPNRSFDLVKICASVEEYAHEVFAFFRLCDRKNIETIYCETVAETGIGAALMDRLKRAAQN